MSYQDRLQRYEQEKKKLQKQNLSPEDYMREIIKLANKWRVQLWKSVVKIVCIMTQTEQTNRVVVVLVGVILKATEAQIAKYESVVQGIRTAYP